ncbi:MAG TPA: acyl carrier protein [Pyrinomonadaceae bacterium]|nr:acyl carrier protein [Pyrinomonadaceae bacterium]
MIDEKLQQIFKEIFSDVSQINENSKRADIEKWDSLNHLNLIVELEDKFDVSFTIEEIEDLDSVAKIVKKLTNRFNKD